MLPNLSDLSLTGALPLDQLNVLQPVFDAIVLGNRAEYAVDLPTDAPAKIKALQAAVLAICASGAEYNRFCRHVLPTYLKPEVIRIQRDVLPRLRDEVKAKLDETNDWLIYDWSPPFTDVEGARLVMNAELLSETGIEKGEDRLPWRPKISKTLRNLNEWDVWDVLSRRNGMPDLKDLGSLATATLGGDSNGKTYYNMPQNRRLYVSNETVMTMLAHIWGVETWATRHMVIFQPVEMHVVDGYTLIVPANEVIHGPVEAMDMSKVTAFDSTEFVDSIDFFDNEPIGAWDMSNVEDMQTMFAYKPRFNQPIGGWDVSKVTNMEQMFREAAAFNQPIRGWDVSNVTNMKHMFNAANAFNQPLDGWDVSNVTTMSEMFSGAHKFNQPIERWNVSNVKFMTGMFSNSLAFNQPLDGWDVSNVKSMMNMFSNSQAFNQSIVDWDVSNNPRMDRMFYEAISMQRENVPWYTGRWTSEE